MTRMLIRGLSATAPNNKNKEGKDFNRGDIHTEIALAAAYKDGGVERGNIGISYQCDAELVRKLEGVSLPFLADVDIRTVMKFNKPENQIFGIVPVVGGAK